MDNNTGLGKPIWKSKTFWSDVLTIVVAGLQVSDQYFGTHLMANGIAPAALSVLGVLGIYGRKTADTQISNVI
jgi:hypothetical protein